MTSRWFWINPSWIMDLDNNLVKTITGNCWLIGIIKNSYSSFFKGHSVAMVRDTIMGRMAKNVTL